MLRKELKHSYNDVAIVPSELSSVEHRSECNPYVYSTMLPLFTAPMASVVNEKNYKTFEDCGINAILPRTVDFEIRKEYISQGKWVAVSLSEFEELFLKDFEQSNLQFYSCVMHVLIDMANGHMAKLYDVVSAAKEKHGSSICIMIGNIANPNTYYHACMSGADYVRLSIGTGFSCITTSNVAVHYPIASLIDEVVTLRDNMINNKIITKERATKIVADGGIRGYSDIIKALALGADYVMIGSVFAKMVESAAETFYIKSDGSEETIDQFNSFLLSEIGNVKIGKLKWKKRYFGMSTKKAQELCGCKELKTSEGIEKVIDVEYTIEGWVDNFISYLRSAMSYTNSKTLEDFKKSELIVISNNTFNSVNK